MKVRDAVAESLVAEGAEVVFSLLGDTNMALVVRLSELGLPVYQSRHEATAMAMADGYARASRRVAICSTTAGPGFAHTLVPMVSASRRTPSPVVVLTGPHSRDALDNRQAIDHQAIATIADVHYRPVGSAAVAVERVRSVVDLALSDGKPVVLDIPADIQELEYPWDVDPRPAGSWKDALEPEPNAASIEEAVQLIAAAKRPVVLAGGGATSEQARDELAALATACGGLLATTVNARGRFYGEPFNAGVAGLFSRPSSAQLFGDADCVIAFGASLNLHTLVNGYLFPSARFVQVDIKPAAPMETGDSADCYVKGDAVAAARAMRLRLAEHGPMEGFRTEGTKKALAADVDTMEYEIEPNRVDPRVLCAELDELLPDDCGMVSGAAHYWSFPQMHMSRWREPLLYSSYFGSIGYTIAVATGAAVASERPIVVFEGDGGFLMNPHAIEAAVDARARLLVVLMNDARLGAEYHKLRAKGLNPELAAGPERDLAAIAEQFGCPAGVLTDLHQLPGMVEKFRASDGPYLIDARISKNVVSIPYRRAYFGIE